MTEKPTSLVLDTKIVQSLKRKGFNVSKLVRDYLKEFDKLTNSNKKRGER